MSEHADIHADLGVSAKSFIEREGALARLRRLRDTEAGFDRAVWSKLGDLGWLGLLVPQRHGGAGLGLSEMAVLAREFGRALMPEPLTAGAVFAASLLRCAETSASARLLTELTRGALFAAVAWQERLGGIDPGRVATESVPAAHGVRVSGCKRFVAFGASAAGYLVTAQASGGLELYWIPKASAGLDYQPLRRADGSEHGTLLLDRVEVGPEQIVAAAGTGKAVLARALDEAVVMTSAELLGVAERALEISLDYLRTRVQFGKPIGSFQALQHRCVDMFIAKELGISAFGAALTGFDTAEPQRRAALASRAKARCAEAALDICRKAIQMHGAMGFTDECDIGLYLKRALVLSAWLGNAQVHRRRYAALMLAPAASARATQAGHWRAA